MKQWRLVIWDSTDGLEDIMLSEGTRDRKQTPGAHSHVGAGKVGFAEIQARVGVPHGLGN